MIIRGDATHNNVLEVAGIHEAKALIACVADDSDNLVIALSVKALRPDLRVICRAKEMESERKLRLAGADAVVAPQAVGGRTSRSTRIAARIGAKYSMLWWATARLNSMLRSWTSKLDSAVDGRTIRESGLRQESGALILAVEGEAENFTVNPGPEVRLTAGDRLVVVGTKEQMRKAADIVQPTS